MKRQFHNEGNVKSTLIREDEDKVYIQTDIEDSGVHDKNKRMRESGMLRHGADNPLMEGGETVYWFSFDPMSWSIAQRKHPDLFQQAIHGRDEKERLDAARKLKFLYPGEVVIYDGLR